MSKANAGPRALYRQHALAVASRLDYADYLAEECRDLFGQARHIIRTLQKQAPEPPSGFARRSSARRQARPHIQVVPEPPALTELEPDAGWSIPRKSLVVTSIMCLSLVPSFLFYAVHRHLASHYRPVKQARGASVSALPIRRSLSVPAPSEVPAGKKPQVNTRLRPGTFAGLQYTYGIESDGIKIVLTPTPAGKSAALSAIIAAVIRDVYGADKLTSPIPHVVPGDTQRWLKYRGKEVDYFAAFSYATVMPPLVNGCYVWVRPKD